MAHLVAARNEMRVLFFYDVEVGLWPREDLLDFGLGPPLHRLGPPFLCQSDVSVVHVQPTFGHACEHVPDLSARCRVVDLCQERAVAELAALLPVPVHQLKVEYTKRPSSSTRGHACARSRVREQGGGEPALTQQPADRSGESAALAVEPVQSTHVDQQRRVHGTVTRPRGGRITEARLAAFHAAVELDGGGGGQEDGQQAPPGESDLDHYDC
mmetsp:Transcript_15414/g.27222  ORF Transcript_15414/g.27222 Transcript_15414/m.27222 type:complete len:213 (+) Transcript_15414:798-1436(+)